MKFKREDSVFDVTEFDGIPVVSSRKVGEVFAKRHDNILRDIENIKVDLLKVEEIKWEQNFQDCTWICVKKNPCTVLNNIINSLLLNILSF